MHLSQNTLAAFDRIDAVFIEIDRNYRVVSFNRKAGRIFDGLSLGSICYQAVTGKNQVCRDCPAKKVLDNRADNRSGQIQRTVSGKTLFFDSTASPVTDETGAVTGALLLLNDITLHKIREKKMAGRQNDLEHIIRERTKVLKEKENRLKQTIRELEGIIEALPGMVSVVDRQFNILIVNKAVVKEFGKIDKNEVLGKKCFQVRKGILVPCPQCAVAEAFETGRLVSRYSTPGEEKQMGIATQSFAVPLKDDSGKIWAGVEVIMDITELRQVEKALKESQERLDLALESANEGIWDWNLETGEALFDARYYTICGYEPGEFPPAFEEWKKRVHPEDLPGALERFEKCISGKSDVYDAEFRFLHKTGNYMWIHGKGKVVSRNEKGEALRFVGIHCDITERKKVEQFLRVNQFMFDAAAVGIYHINSDAKIITVNQQAADNLDYSIEELIGASIFDIDPSVNQDNWGDMWKSLLKTGSDRFETTHQRKDGRLVPVEITSNLIEYDNEQFSICFVQDISERKEMEQRLLQSQKMEAIGALAGGIAHDFNNILGAIIGCTELIAMGMPDDCRERRHLNQILKSTHRAAELIQQILTFSRHTDVKKIPLKINLIVKEVFKLSGVRLGFCRLLFLFLGSFFNRLIT